MKAPIILFVYNRLKHTRTTVEYLKNNIGALESDLFIYSDGPVDVRQEKAVNEVRDYIKTISGFRSVTVSCREENRGLAKSVISGVTEIVGRYGKVIVLEDDIITGRYFLEYMNEALNRYEKSDKVYSVTGYMRTEETVQNVPESYFLVSSCSWGWGTWKRSWDCFESEPKGWEALKNDKEKQYRFNCYGTMKCFDMLEKQMTFRNYNSWAVRWHWTIYKNNGLTLYPNRKMCENIGNDCTGIHSGFDGKNHELNPANRVMAFPDIMEEVEKYRIAVYTRMKADSRRERGGRILSYVTHPAAVMTKLKRKFRMHW